MCLRSMIGGGAKSGAVESGCQVEGALEEGALEGARIDSKEPLDLHVSSGMGGNDAPHTLLFPGGA